MSNNIQWKPTGYSTGAIFDTIHPPMNMTYRYFNPSGSVSNVIATYYLDGTLCATDGGAQYNLTWESTPDTPDSYYSLRINLSGGTAPKSFILAPSANAGTFITDERNSYSGSPVTYVVTWDLIITSTQAIVSSGNVVGSPGNSIFTFDTNCPL